MSAPSILPFPRSFPSRGPIDLLYVTDIRIPHENDPEDWRLVECACSLADVNCQLATSIETAVRLAKDKQPSTVLVNLTSMTRVWNYFESSRNSDVGYGLLRDLTVNRLQSQHTAALTRADRLPALIRKDPRLVGTRIFGVTNYDTPEYREALKRVGYDEVFAPGEWLAEVMTQVRAINSRQLAA